ncbi:2'-5' RNA ligase family protein [Streptomyces sp. M10(2022)]
MHELTGAVAPLHALPGAVNLRWTAAEGRHYTLAFFGSVDEELFPELHGRLERAAHRTRPSRCASGAAAGSTGGRCGRGRGRARHDAAAGRPCERRRAQVRVEMEKHRHYVPHLTLARSRVQADLTPYTEALDGFEGLRWEAGELSLVRSHPPVDGVPGSSPLRGRAGLAAGTLSGAVTLEGWTRRPETA